ncbi:acetone carboxylase subunit gamma [Salicibibacter kimchii]|uniref:Acetone carboxylase subunit gamma n=1 Tax=Salicibibacter kimchii TaxID=2099786 RepID=A0A345C0J3_9BACI|nr:acetone carboxylase subunit gamma [Salicibibacter kimchii]AXF56724.1 acetone carboxylase subunit gamma [Salicibibacter kimchii]
MASYNHDTIRDLIDGQLPWQSTRSIMSQYKDDDRFFKYIDILQEQVKFNDPILLPIGEHLYIVAKQGEPQGERVVKCGCGYEFGHYTSNWKLKAAINVRDDEEEIAEIYPGRHSYDPEWMEIREFICPGCATLLEVEAAAPGYPIVFDFLPDLETFYHDWLDRELPVETIPSPDL